MTQPSVEIVAYRGTISPEERPAPVEPVYRVFDGTAHVWVQGNAPPTAAANLSGAIDESEAEFQIALGEWTRVEPPIAADADKRLLVTPAGLLYDVPERLTSAMAEIWEERLGRGFTHMVRNQWEAAGEPLAQACCARPEDPAAELLLAAIYRRNRQFEEWESAVQHVLGRANLAALRTQLGKSHGAYRRIHHQLPEVLTDTLDDIEEPQAAGTFRRHDTNAPWSGRPLYAKAC